LHALNFATFAPANYGLQILLIVLLFIISTSSVLVQQAKTLNSIDQSVKIKGSQNYVFHSKQSVIKTL